MMDPSMMQAQMAASSSNPESNDLSSRSQLFSPAVAHNAQIVEHVRGLMSIFAGAAAGVLGVTGIIQGACVFIIFHILTSLGLLAKIKLTGKVSNYLPTKWYAFLVADAANHLLSFLLFWTMGYTLIHIY
ncbi:hypothetical protein NSK_007138 [Nannochloropsis salina CCMP1776]|uniref:ER membrane protein complex subunit 6 n=1 Tax=Nannochloropsis salina CCMP1776 TaxID=1027361 RepID=A0A4D9CRL4_9STRA|nr:hypothetical protein NSK_007138 [Nannochloropsis salina CCMP1776]|eukprot:TFJ81891.1 hypothetical protein NSK_007138 [Nannochloropsis salina CCMP1776]